jgi:hypothetical protein
MADQKFSLKKPWLFTEYKKMMCETTEKEIYTLFVAEIESQFKKPYLKNNHPESELLFTPPGQTGPPVWIPGGPPGGDCSPVIFAVGGGALDPCNPALSCGVWEISCAHKITGFGVPQSNGWIQSVTYGTNDSVRVVVCWDENLRYTGQSTGVLVYTSTGAVFSATLPFDCVGQGSEPGCITCYNCPAPYNTPEIFYTTQQMQLNGTQYIYASGGAGGPYSWSITAGSGTLSGSYGMGVTYTAPSANVNCANNPTIKAVDVCGNSVTISFAVTNPAASGTAVVEMFCVESGSCTANKLRWTSYNCLGDETGPGAQDCNSCISGGVDKCCMGHWDACGSSTPPCVDACTCSCEQLVLACKHGQNSPGYDGTCKTTPGFCDTDYHDIRTDELKALACCPAQLLPGYEGP